MSSIWINLGLSALVPADRDDCSRQATHRVRRSLHPNGSTVDHGGGEAVREEWA